MDLQGDDGHKSPTRPSSTTFSQTSDDLVLKEVKPCISDENM